MKFPAAKSAVLRLGLAVILVESLALALLGFFFMGRFSARLDQALLDRAKVPGLLMSRQLLRYESVADREIMVELVGEEFVDGMVVTGSGEVYDATQRSRVGQSVRNIDEVSPDWFDRTRTDPAIHRLNPPWEDYLVAVVPIAAFPGAEPFFCYIKIHGGRTGEMKRSMATAFILGSALCLLLTSAGIIWRLKRSVFEPMARIRAGAADLARGNPDQALDLTRQDELGDLARVFAAMRGAIREKMAELSEVNRQLNEDKRRLDAFVSALPDLVFLVDEHGRYLEILAGPGQNLLFAEASALQGRLMAEVLPPDLADLFLATLRRTARTQSIQVVEYEMGTPAGLRWFEGRCACMAPEPGQPTVIVWVARDVTARKEQEASLRRAKEEAEAANRALRKLDEMKTAFLSSVSHELRTPLTSLLGFAKVASKTFIKHFMPLSAGDTLLEARGEQILNDLSIMECEGQRLTRLINDILDLSKIESGRMIWNDLAVDPDPLLRRAAETMRAQFAMHPAVGFSLRLDHGLPQVLADPDRLHQVVINLLHNALKFTPAGSVTLTATAPEPGVLRVEVRDTGPGIKPEFLDKVFEKFLQAPGQESLGDKPQGTGLGLAICRQIVEHYRGTIRVETEPGRGSAFIVELPGLPPGTGA